MNITYDYYKIFYHVARCGSFTRAAAMLYNSQPNITRAIKNLESELGSKLFVRTRKGVELTPEGEKLYAHVSVAVEQIRAGEEELAAQAGLDGGVVVIGVTEIALHCHVLDVLQRFHESYPNVRIRLMNDSTPQAISSVKSGLAELAVVISPTHIERPLEVTVLKEVREVAVCSKRFAELHGRRVTLAELAEYPIIMLGAQAMSREFYSKLFEKHGVVLTPDIEASTVDQILPMVKHELGVGFVPIDLLRDTADRDTFEIVDIVQEIPPRDICLIKSSERSLGLAARRLEEMLRS